jgi:cell division transport system permease protein
MSLLRYYVRDAREGIRRNARAAVAAMLLIFLSLSLTGCLVLVKESVQDVVDFLESQVKVKILVKPGTDVEQLAQVLREEKYVTAVTVERKEETLARLKRLFDGREYLFQAFLDGEFPDSVVVELRDKSQGYWVAKELAGAPGIVDVVYPQEYAEKILEMATEADRFGIAVLGVFLLASLLTVSLAIHLAIFQREKEIRIKLLLGAKESHVQGQFLLEGALLGLAGSLPAGLSVYAFHTYGLMRLQVSVGALFQVEELPLQWVMVGLALGGTLIGVLGSYLATRKRIAHG